MERPATLSTVIGTESESWADMNAGSECENREPVAPAPAPGDLASLCVCEKESTATLCV